MRDPLNTNWLSYLIRLLAPSHRKIVSALRQINLLQRLVGSHGGTRDCLGLAAIASILPREKLLINKVT